MIMRLLTTVVLWVLFSQFSLAQSPWRCTHAPFNARGILSPDGDTPIVHSSTLIRVWDHDLNEWDIRPIADDVPVSESGFVLATDGTVYVSSMTGSVYKSTDSGRSFTITGAQIPAASPNKFAANNGKIFAASLSYGSLSTNDGLSWTQIISPPFTTIEDVAVSPSGRLMISHASSVKYSDNNGSSWTNSSIPSGGMNIQQFLNNSIVHGITFSGQSLVRSIDGGLSFYSIGISGIIGTHFFSETQGVAIAQNVVYHTNNSGESWEMVDSPSMPNPVLYMSFADELNGFLISSSQVFKTIDGGVNWNAMANSNVPFWISSTLSNRYIGEGNTWYAIGNNNSAVTYDNGASFTAMYTQFDNRSNVLYHGEGVFTAEGFGTNAQMPWKSIDEGNTWTGMNANHSPIERSQYISENDVWILNSDVIKKTTNGSTWTSIPGNQIDGGSPKAFDRIDAMTAYVLVQTSNFNPYYTLFKTTNNGANFTEVSQMALNGVYSDYRIDFADPDSGVIYLTNSNLFWRTADGGMNFEQMTSLPPVDFSNILGMSCAGSERIYQKRTDGSLLESEDWGETWYDHGGMYRYFQSGGLHLFNDRITMVSPTGHVFQQKAAYEPDPIVILPGDLDEDGQFDIGDLLILLNDWGCNEDCIADLNGDGIVNAADLLILLGLM